MGAPFPGAGPRRRAGDRPAVPRIVVLGGGVGGVEAALTMAAGLPDAKVTLVGMWPTLRLLPNLLHVPLGGPAATIELPLDALLPARVRRMTVQVDQVDVPGRCLHSSAGRIEFDVLVAAPGAQPRAASCHTLRSLEDAERLGRELAALTRDPRGHRSICIRCSSAGSWTAPACELALLLDRWLVERGLRERTDVVVATCDDDVFDWFGPVGEATVEAALRRAGVRTVSGLTADELTCASGDIVVDFDALQARVVDGLPGLGSDGWYEPDARMEVAPDVHVVGDATALPYRAAFAMAWQSRKVLRALGGDLSLLGGEVDGVPLDQVEYQMDLGTGVLRARLPGAALAGPDRGYDARVSVEHGAHAEKLAGLLVHRGVQRMMAAAGMRQAG